MTEIQTRTRITYQGNPALVGALAQFLREEGVEVEPYEAPLEQRDLAGAAQDVVTQLIAAGGIAAITAAVNHFRRRFQDRGSITIEPDDAEAGD